MPSSPAPDVSLRARDVAVRPRDAASLAIVRTAGRAAEVLLGRRASAHAFLPDVYVFPGGGVQPEDRRVEALEPFPEHERAGMRPSGSRALAQALAAAAARETHEETGLVFGRIDRRGLRPALGGFRYLGRAITPASSPIRFHARFFVVEGAHAAGELAGSGELLDLRWVRIEDALAMPLLDVTGIMVREIARRLAGAPPRRPFVHYRGDQVCVRHE